MSCLHLLSGTSSYTCLKPVYIPQHSWVRSHHGKGTEPLSTLRGMPWVVETEVQRLAVHFLPPDSSLSEANLCSIGNLLGETHRDRRSHTYTGALVMLKSLLGVEWDLLSAKHSLCEQNAWIQLKAETLLCFREAGGAFIQSALGEFKHRTALCYANINWFLSKNFKNKVFPAWRQTYLQKEMRLCLGNLLHSMSVQFLCKQDLTHMVCLSSPLLRKHWPYAPACRGHTQHMRKRGHEMYCLHRFHWWMDLCDWKQPHKAFVHQSHFTRLKWMPELPGLTYCSGTFFVCQISCLGASTLAQLKAADIMRTQHL